MSDSSQIKPTYTYQGNLNMVIRIALEALCENQPVKAFDALEVLYYYFVDEVEAEVKNQYAKINTMIAAVAKIKGVEFYHTRLLRDQATRRMITTEVRPFLHGCIQAMHKHNLLIENWGAKPKFSKEGKI